MFRMEFQALDAVREEDDQFSKSYKNDVARGKGVYEKFRHRTVESSGSPSRVYEGWVGKYGKMLRTASAKEVLHSGAHLSKVLTRSVSSAASVPQSTKPKNWVEVDLIDFGSPKAVEEPATVDQEVLRELVKPFAESVNLTQQPGGKRLDTDVFVSFLEYQPANFVQRDLTSSGRDLMSDRDLPSGGVEFGSFRNVESMPTRSNSMRSTSSISWSDSSDAEGSNYYGDRAHIKDEEKGSPVARAYNRAFNKLMHKKNKLAAPDSKFAKPWEEPLLPSHDQLNLQRKLRKEAKRQAEQDKRDAERRKRELLDLANPIPESALSNQKEQYNMRKGIHKLLQLSGGIHSTGTSPKDGDTRDSKLMSRSSIFETCMSPSATDVALSHIRSGPRQSSRKDIHFATVESNQRDVEAWTMEEYLAKNARIPGSSARRVYEEFGGIEGNQLLNRYFDDDVTDNIDSDSD